MMLQPPPVSAEERQDATIEDINRVMLALEPSVAARIAEAPEPETMERAGAMPEEKAAASVERVSPEPQPVKSILDRIRPPESATPSPLMPPADPRFAPPAAAPAPESLRAPETVPADKIGQEEVPVARAAEPDDFLFAYPPPPGFSAAIDAETAKPSPTTSTPPENTSEEIDPADFLLEPLSGAGAGAAQPQPALPTAEPERPVLTPPTPASAPDDPLAPLRALSPEEKIALFT
jgi:hypothetical protein